MQKTPHKTSQHIDQIIDQLNARWDLQIPRIHGAAAAKAGNGSDLGKKCSSRIRALCWNGNVNMQSIVEEFEDKIKHKYSYWIWKPGMLPSLCSTESFLKQDAISSSQAISSQRRQTFLEVLSGLLEEEHKLVTESDQYQRTPSNFTRSSSRQRSLGSSRPTSPGSFITADVKMPDMIKASKLAKSQPASLKKREASQTTTASSKRAKPATVKPTAIASVKDERGQQKLDNIMKRQSNLSTKPTPLDQSALIHTSACDPVVTSFTTNISEDPLAIFSDQESRTPHSNATSFMSVDSDDNDRRITEASGTQYSQGTEIDEEFHNDANAQRSFTMLEAQAGEDISTTTVSQLLDDLSEKGLFNDIGCPLPPNLSYWFVFELYRISQAMSLGKVNWLWSTLRNKHKREQLPANEFWEAVKAIHREINPDQQEVRAPLPAKSAIPEWLAHNESYCDPDSGNSMSFTGRLDFSENPTSKLFDFKLNPVKYEKSCRFHRHFGADRFLTIDMPYFDQHLLDEHTRNMPRGQQKLPSLHEIMFDRLTTQDLHIAGRIWRTFYVEPIKSRTKQKRKEEKPRQRLHLFAIDGYGFVKSETAQNRSMSLLEFLESHLLLDHNHHSTDMKLFARIQLGLSTTLSTVVLEPDEFVNVPDIPAQDEHGQSVTDTTIMTDGCARISYPLACAVWACHQKTEQNVPSAFQARIGGAKGLWQVDYSTTNPYPNAGKRGYWIEIRDSQLKIKPHPVDRKAADKSQRTFEVVKYATPCVPGHLNIQLINIMHYCGIPRSAFREALNTDLTEYLETLKDAMHDPLKLRVWRQLNHRPPSDTVDFCGGMPDGKEHELDYLLESGFAPKSCRYLNGCVKSLLKQKLDNYANKLRIEVDASTTVFCVPDPLGILAPGEVQLNFSTTKIDPRTKLPEMHLESPRVLVARNPAHLKSDIQLVKAVYHHELRHLKDVIIFPTKGRYPLADLLSGGDYDGDTVTVIWDPNLTEEFCNHEKPRLATKAECGVVSKTKYVGDVFNVTNPTSKQLENFIHSCCSLNGFQSKLGRVTVELETLVYADIGNLGKPGPEKLAALAGYLVDSAKQGDSVSDKDWNELQSEIRSTCTNKPLPEPQYKLKNPNPRRDALTRECLNVVDYLKFDVGRALREEVLAGFKSDWTENSTHSDEDIMSPYSHERKRANDSRISEHKLLGAVLDDLCKQVEAVKEEWRRRCGKEMEDSFSAEFGNTNKAVENDFVQVVQELSERIRAIEPVNVDCDIRRDFDREGGRKGTRWSILRASCVHYKCQGGIFAWKMVGNELCTIKARAQGRTWEMTLAARQFMKADPKKFKRLNEDQGGGDMEFYNAEG